MNSIEDTITRAEEPEHRVTVKNVTDWQEIRSQHDELAKDPNHMLTHIMKCLGPVSARLEHEDHDEDYEEIEEKRIADLVICSIWMGESLDYNVPELVANRMWDIGIEPVRGELPAEERNKQ